VILLILAVVWQGRARVRHTDVTWDCSQLPNSRPHASTRSGSRA